MEFKKKAGVGHSGKIDSEKGSLIWWSTQFFQYTLKHIYSFEDFQISDFRRTCQASNGLLIQS